MRRKLTVAVETFPLQIAFVISRGAKNEAVTLVATISEGKATGRGECVPYARYDETPQSVQSVIESVRGAVESGCSRDQLQNLLPAGAARNALDCALWDLEAKIAGIAASQLAGLDALAPAITAYTISAGSPEAMAAAVRGAAGRPVLKIKLSGTCDEDKIAAVRQAAPACELIADANEACSEDNLESLLAACAAAQVAVLEQPLPVGKDACLADLPHPIKICADESVHTAQDLKTLRPRYDAVNIKLDKAGGLTAALAMVHEAQACDLAIMVGSMVASSLAMAPAMLLTPYARWVDLDGPLLMAQDRTPGLRYDGSIIHPPTADVWG